MTSSTARESSTIVCSPRAGVSGFLGRRDQIAELVELLAGARLVTLTGPPGIGKSRLALEVAAKRPDRRSSAVTVVELAPVGDAALVPAALAASLPVQEAPGSVLETVVARLRERRVLLVLDNCEHLVDACAELVDSLLGACPGLTILATGREPLAIAGEVVWQVPPLSIPDRSAPARAERLMDYEAICLFVERAGAVEPGFALNGYIAPAVTEICRRLDGIPLAIELAAARVESLTPAEIAGRLDARFDLLTDGSPGEPHQRALETAIDWSHQLLSVSERALLRRLAVFAGGFDLQAAASVCVGDEFTAAAVPELIERLVSKSLVVAAEEGRFRLLETIRAYAGERLEESGEARAVREAHARFYMALAEEAEPQLTGAAQQRWFERLEPEGPNFRSALDWAVGHGRGEWGLRLSGALVFFWRERCHFSEGRELLAAALAAGGGAQAPLRAKALWGEGFLVLMAGDSEGAMPLLEESLARFRKLDDVQGAARALLLLGNAMGRSDGPRGLTLVEESMVLARSAGDAWCLAITLGVAGMEYCSRNELAIARPLFEECLSVARLAEDKHGLRIGLIGLARVALREGNYRSAEPLLEECMSVSDEVGEIYDKGTAMGYLGEAAFVRGDYGRARELLDGSISLLRRARPADLVPPLVMRARVARAAGEGQKARDLAEEALTLARTKAESPTAALCGMAELAAEEGNPVRARRLLEESLELTRPGGKLARARALEGLGRLARGEEAAAFHGEALHLREEIGNRLGIATSLEDLALAAGAGQLEHAVRLFAAAQRIREQNGYARTPSERACYERALTLAQDRLSEEKFAIALTDGRGLSLSEAVVCAFGGPTEVKPGGWPTLTASEQEVASLVGQGLTNPEIARRLFFSVATVKARVSSIFSKLDLTKRSQLVRELARIEQQSRDADR